MSFFSTITRPTHTLAWDFYLRARRLWLEENEKLRPDMESIVESVINTVGVG